MGKVRLSEHEIQSAFVAWARANEELEPRLRRLFAIPNGGHRAIGVAKRLKAEGVRAGVPDMFLASPDQYRGGMWIEFKSPDGRVTDAQAAWLEDSIVNGDAVAVCYSVDDAIYAIAAYLGREVRDGMIVDEGAD